MQLRFGVDHPHALGQLGLRRRARLTRARPPVRVRVVVPQKAGARMDVEGPPILRERPLAAKPRRRYDNAALHPRLDGDEIVEMVAHVLLHRRGRLQVRADLGIDLVPGPADIGGAITPQRIEILVETLGLLRLGPRLADRPLAGAQGFALVVYDDARASGPQARARTAQARPLDDDLRHVLAHGARGLS